MKFTIMGIAVVAVLFVSQIVMSHDSAIDQAALLEHALERVTCSVPQAEQEDCNTFSERLLKNKILLNAFEYARRKKVDIIISTRFHVGAGYVMFNIKASDKQIINFLFGERRFVE